MGLRVSGYYWNERGQFRNQITGNHVGGGEGYGVAATLNFDPKTESVIGDAEASALLTKEYRTPYGLPPQV